MKSIIICKALGIKRSKMEVIHDSFNSLNKAFPFYRKEGHLWYSNSQSAEGTDINHISNYKKFKHSTGFKSDIITAIK